MTKQPVYYNSHARFNIPPYLAREVGRIIVRWAYLEHTVQRIVWLLLQVTYPFGRLAVREPRLEDRISLLRTLAELRGIILDNNILTTIQSRIKKTAPDRDTLAHGIWVPQNGEWRVLLTRGKWSDNEPHPSSKSVVPEALTVTTGALRGIAAHIEQTVELVMAVGDAIQKKLPRPPEVHPERFPRKVPKQSRTSSKPRHRR